jgi:hypothetical protein
MMESAKKLEQTRLAILEHLHQKERSDRPAAAGKVSAGPAESFDSQGNYRAGRPARRPRSSGWFGRLSYAAGTWWRHHPAHMVVELSTPAITNYARRKPYQYLGIAAAAGALLLVARPWRLISVTGILVALFRSSQLSSLVMSALSAADFKSDDDRQR